MLQYLLTHPNSNRSDLHQIQSTAGLDASADASAAAPTDHTYAQGDNQVLAKADSTLNILIGMVVTFLLINVVIICVYVLRRNYYNRKIKRKLDVLSLDGTTDDDLKRSMKFNDGDESFILDIVRRKNEYVPVKRYHSPINGFLLSRHYSTSTVDTHTKVSDWISQELNRQSLKDSEKKMSISPSYTLSSKTLFSKNAEKVSVAVDATPGARTESILRQHPIELMKSKSFDYPTKDMIICQEVDVRRDLLDSVHLREAHRALSIPSLKELSPAPVGNILRIDHRPSRSEPVPMLYHSACNRNEDITSFIIEDVDVNVTSRDECDGAISHFSMTPEETLQVIQMRNYPKVLPKFPEDCSEYVSTSSFKRRSMPSHQCLINQLARMPPAPPPRTTSTLGRNTSIRSDSSNISDLMVTSPVQRALEPMTLDEEPEITYNALHVGPLLPGSKENLYSTIKKAPLTGTTIDEVQSENTMDSVDTVDSVVINIGQDSDSSMGVLSIQNVPNIDRTSGIKPPSGYKSKEERISMIPQPKVKPILLRQSSTDSNKSNSGIPRVTPIYTGCATSAESRIPMLRASSGSSSSSGSGTSNESSTSSGSTLSSENNQDRSASVSSSETASSTGTIKHIV